MPDVAALISLRAGGKLVRIRDLGDRIARRRLAGGLPRSSRVGNCRRRFRR